jgi:hypothetical protein
MHRTLHINGASWDILGLLFFFLSSLTRADLHNILHCPKNVTLKSDAPSYSTNTLKTIRSLTTADAASCTDCCICLFRIASFQSLFVAPCSHVYHYKCIRPMLMAHHPGFLCPLCRTFADLEATVEIDDPVEEQAAVQSK